MLVTGRPIRLWVQPERLGEVDCSTSCMGYVTEKIWNTEPESKKTACLEDAALVFVGLYRRHNFVTNDSNGMGFTDGRVSV